MRLAFAKHERELLLIRHNQGDQIGLLAYFVGIGNNLTTK